MKLEKDKALIDITLKSYLKGKGKLFQAMRYSILAGGKRFRPILCLAVADCLGSDRRRVLPYACAVEMVHTFTLIHDDLPAMDDSDFRRGKKTSHKVYGEALAILAGDALNSLAFKLIADQPKALAVLAQSLLKVVEGQVSDLNMGKKRLSLKEMLLVHEWKTGSLLKACVIGSALICAASKKKIDLLANYAHHLGLAFQITDDILDVTSTKKYLGKPVKADKQKGFPSLIGLERSMRIAEQEKQRALRALVSFGSRADSLRALAEFVVKRSS